MQQDKDELKWSNYDFTKIPFDDYVQSGLDRVGSTVNLPSIRTELPAEGFIESLGYEGSRANLNPFNIVKNILQNPTPSDVENMMNCFTQND